MWMRHHPGKMGVDRLNRSLPFRISMINVSCSDFLHFLTVLEISTNGKTFYEEIESNYSVFLFFYLEYIINFIYFLSKTFTEGLIFERQLDYQFYRASQEISFNHNFLL